MWLIRRVPVGGLSRVAASPLWAIDLMGGYLAGETVLVLGPGPIGLIAVQLCKALGAERIAVRMRSHAAAGSADDEPVRGFFETPPGPGLGCELLPELWRRKDAVVRVSPA